MSVCLHSQSVRRGHLPYKPGAPTLVVRRCLTLSSHATHVFISRARSPLTKGSSHSPDIYTAVPRCTRIIFFMIHSSGPSRSFKSGGWWRVNCTFIAQLPPSFPSSFSHPAPQLSAHQARASYHPDRTLTALSHLWCAVALCQAHSGTHADPSRRLRYRIAPSVLLRTRPHYPHSKHVSSTPTTALAIPCPHPCLPTHPTIHQTLPSSPPHY